MGLPIALPPQDAVVSSLYRAAARQVSWREAMLPMLPMFRAWGITLLGLDPRDRSIGFSHSVGGLGAEDALDYVRNYHRLDPRVDLMFGLAVGEWVNCDEYFDDAFVATDRFYQEFLIPAGCRYASGTMVFRDDTLAVLFVIERSVGAEPLSPADVALGRTLAGHLAAAFELWRQEPTDVVPGSAGHALLDRLPQPVMLIDETLRLHHANLAAHRLLASGRGLIDRAGTLGAAGGTRDADLMQAVRRLRLGAAPEAPGSDKVVLRIPSAEGAADALAVVLVALHPSETLGIFGRRDLAMVLVHDLQRRLVPDALVIEAAFELTPAEARVAARIANGEKVEAIAAAHGVLVATVRTQLSQVFAKVGVGRQQELVARILALPADPS